MSCAICDFFGLSSGMCPGRIQDQGDVGSVHDSRCLNSMSFIFVQSNETLIKKRISSNILGGAIGSAFGCYDCKVQATGRFLVRSQAEELPLLLFPSTGKALGILLQPAGSTI